jgi:1,2-diacylglycerol 3-beta-galactosyltransferase
MILRPEFYAEQKESRAAIRQQLGLDLQLPTAIVLFGGYGSNVIYEIAEQISAAHLPLQMIVVCGKNEKLAERLRAQRWSIPMHVVGFTGEVNRLMRAADFLIGKPGPGSIAEAMISGLPVLVECNSSTLPQERYNTEWVKEKGVGGVVRKFRNDVVGAVKSFLEPGQLEGMKKNVRALHNRAVFEIPEFLACLLAEGEPDRPEISSSITAAG